MKTSLALLICLVISLGTFSKPELRHNVYFNENRVEMTASIKHILDTVYQKLPEGKYLRIIPQGAISDDLNIYKASEIHSGRAEAIYNYYLNAGIPQESLEIIDKQVKASSGLSVYGGVYASNDLEISVHKKPMTREAVYSSLSEYFPQVRQTFTIDPSRTTTIKGEQGTKLTFPAFPFECNNGELTVELMEFYSAADLLKADLHTMSSGFMLETGGTIHVKAFCDGQETQLAMDKEMTMEFPVKGDYEDGMQTFLGDGVAGNMDWVATENGVLVEVCDTFYTENPEPPYDLMLSVSCQMVPEDMAENWNAEMFWDEGMEYYDTEVAANDEALDSYILSSGSLGWINCDKFYEEPNTTEFIVEVDTSYHPSVRMVFKDINSVMSGWADAKGNVSFSGIPVGERVTLIAYSIKDDVPYMAMKEIKITENGYDELRLGKTTKVMMESQLLALK